MLGEVQEGGMRAREQVLERPIAGFYLVEFFSILKSDNKQKKKEN